MLVSNLMASPQAVKQVHAMASRAMVTLEVDTTQSGGGQKDTPHHMESWAVVVDKSGLVVAPLLDADPVYALNLVRTALAASGQKPNEVNLSPAVIKIRLENGKQYPAKVIKRDEPNGLALIKMDAPPVDLDSMTITTVREARMGDDIVVVQPMGAGYGTDVAVTPLTINLAIQKPNYYTVMMVPVQSGCPVFSRDDGAFLGVVVPLVATDLGNAVISSGLQTVSSVSAFKRLLDDNAQAIPSTPNSIEKVCAKYGSAMVSLSWVRKQTGANGQTQESKRLAQALTLTPDGLMVCEGRSMGVFDDSAKVQIADLKATMSDGTSIPVSVVKKDSDWNIAWLKPASAPQKPMPFMDQPAAVSLKLSQDLWSVFRTPEGMGYSIGTHKMCYIGQVSSPVNMPLGMGDGELISPVFTAEGGWVGIVVPPPGDSEYEVDEVTVLPVKDLYRLSGLKMTGAK